MSSCHFSPEIKGKWSEGTKKLRVRSVFSFLIFSRIFSPALRREKEGRAAVACGGERFILLFLCPDAKKPLNSISCKPSNNFFLKNRTKKLSRSRGEGGNFEQDSNMHYVSPFHETAPSFPCVGGRQWEEERRKEGQDEGGKVEEKIEGAAYDTTKIFSLPQILES